MENIFFAAARELLKSFHLLRLVCSVIDTGGMFFCADLMLNFAIVIGIGAWSQRRVQYGFITLLEMRGLIPGSLSFDHLFFYRTSQWHCCVKGSASSSLDRLHDKFPIIIFIDQRLKQILQRMLISLGFSASIASCLHEGKHPCRLITFVWDLLIKFLVVQLVGLHEV